MTTVAIALTCIGMYVLFLWAIREDKPETPQNSPEKRHF